jgi:hypothetical protein
MMDSSNSTPTLCAAHWDRAYRASAVHSWNQDYPGDSMTMLLASGVGATGSVIDVGGGDSPLAATLIATGHRDVTVLDVSEAAITAARARAAGGSGMIGWITTDVLSWVPPRVWHVWHDRAVFHFLTDPADQQRYLGVLELATRPGSVVVIGTFAPEGPTHCSGLPVARYSVKSLLARVGPAFDVIHTDHRIHTTPHGGIQAFTWVALRRKHGQPGLGGG